MRAVTTLALILGLTLCTLQPAQAQKGAFTAQPNGTASVANAVHQRLQHASFVTAVLTQLVNNTNPVFTNNTNLATQRLVTNVYATVLATGVEVADFYVAYMASANTRGVCGCQRPDMKSDPSCYYTDATGKQYFYEQFRITDTPVATSTLTQNAENLDEIFAMTSWTNVGQPHLMQTASLEVFTVATCISFNWNTRTCAAAAAFDVRITAFYDVLATYKSAGVSEAILIDSRDSGYFYASSNEANVTSWAGTLPAPTKTVYPRINSFVTTVLAANGNQLAITAPNGLSFTSNGMSYAAFALPEPLQFLAVYERWPLQQTARVALGAVHPRLMGLSTIAEQLREMAVTTGVNCTALNSTTMFASSFMQAAFSLHSSTGRAAYITLVYALPPPSTIAWGACGCWYFDSTTGLACGFTDPMGQQTIVNPYTEVVTSVVPFDHSSYLAGTVGTLTSDSSDGTWLETTAWINPSTNASDTLSPYVIPMTFDSQSGLATSAIYIATDGGSLRGMLTTIKTAQATGDLYLVDYTNSVIVASTVVDGSAGNNIAALMAQANIGVKGALPIGSTLWTNVPISETMTFIEGYNLATRPGPSVDMGLVEAGASLTAQFSNYGNSLAALATEVSILPVTCTQDIATQNFLQFAAAVLGSYDQEAVHVYFVNNTATSQTPVCGCKKTDSTIGTVCYFTPNLASGLWTAVQGSNIFTGTPVAFDGTVFNTQYITVVAQVDGAGNNPISSAPRSVTDGNNAFTLITLSLMASQTAASPGGGAASPNSAVAVDIRTDALTHGLFASKNAVGSEIALVDLSVFSSPLLVATSDSADVLPPGGLYSPVGTPVPRINAFMAAVAQSFGTHFAASSTEYYQEAGFTYTSYSLNFQYSLFQRTPQTNPSVVIGATVNEAMANAQHVALLLGVSYVGNMEACWNLNNTATSSFLQLAQAVQQLDSNLAMVYVMYLIPNTYTWARCGCRANWSNSNSPVDCFYTDIKGTIHSLNGASPGSEKAQFPATAWGDVPYGQWIAKMTKANNGGVWNEGRVDNSSGVANTVFTYTVPFLFSGSNITAAANFDFTSDAVGSFLSYLSGGPLTTSPAQDTVTNVAIVQANVGSYQGLFLGAGGVSYNSRLFEAMFTPNAAVNRLTATAFSNLFSYSKELAFSYSNTLFHTYPLLSGFTVIASQNFQNQTASQRTYDSLTQGGIMSASGLVDTALQSLTAMAQVIGQTYTISGADCTVNSAPTQQFINNVFAFEQSFSSQVVYAYVVTEPTPTSFAYCGCTTLTPTSNASCYYTTPAGIVNHYAANTLSGTPTSTTPIETTGWITQLFGMPFASASKGFFLIPDSYTDAPTGVSTETLTFVYPIHQNAIGNVDAVACVDIRISAFDGMLQSVAAQTGAEILLLDTRNGGILMSASSAARNAITGAIYGALATPISRINEFVLDFYAIYNYNLTAAFSTTLFNTVSGLQTDGMPIGSNLFILQRTPRQAPVKAAAAAVETLFNTYAQAVQTIGNTFQFQALTTQTCTSLSTAQPILTLMRGFQSRLNGGSVAQIYISYQLGAGGYGVCGCGWTTQKTIACFATQTNGTTVTYDNNFNTIAATPTYLLDVLKYTTMTTPSLPQPTQTLGYWSTSHTFSDGNAALTYAMPLAWSNATVCSVAVSIDILTFSPDVLTALATGGNAHVLYDPRGTGAAIGADAPATTNTVWLDFLVSTVLFMNNDGPLSTAAFSRGTQSYAAQPVVGYPFFVLEEADVITSLIASNQPEASAVAQTSARIQGLFSRYQLMVGALSDVMTGLQVDCSVLTSTTKFIMSSMTAALAANNLNIADFYFVSNVSSTLGACGCVWLNGPSFPYCSYVDRTNTQNFVDGIRLTSILKPMPFVPQTMYTALSQLTVAAPMSWLEPDSWNEPAFNYNATTQMYASCLSFSGSTCTSAFWGEYNLASLASVLNQGLFSQFGEALFIDTRGDNGYFIADSSISPTAYSTTTVYGPLDTPWTRVNEFAELVVNVQSGVTTTWFALGGMLYVGGTFMNNWLLVQRTPMAMPGAISAAIASGSAYVNVITGYQIQTAYQLAGPCNAINPTSGTRSSFLDVSYAIAMSPLGGVAYVDYVLPNGAWGECGCRPINGQQLVTDATAVPQVQCYFTDNTGATNVYNGSQLTQPVGSYQRDWSASPHVKWASTLTPSNSMGAYSPVTQLTVSDGSNFSLPFIMYGVPFNFNGNKPGAVSSFDFPTILFSQAASAAPNNAFLAMVDSRDGSLVASSNWQDQGGVPALTSEDDSVKMLARGAFAMLGSFSQNLAFTINGGLAESTTITNSPYTLLSLDATVAAAQTTQLEVDALNAIGGAVEQYFASFEMQAAALASAYNQTGVDCSVPNAALYEFLNDTAAMLGSFTYRLNGLYIMTRNPITGVFGACGCQYNRLNSAGVDCYYVDKSGMDQQFNGTNPAMAKPTIPLEQGADYEYQLFNLTGSGGYVQPAAWNERLTGGFVFASTYGTIVSRDPRTGVPTVIACTDIYMDFALSDVLATYKTNSLAEVLLVDVRYGGVLLSSSNQNDPNLLTQYASPTQTPVARVNAFALTVLEALGGEWMQDMFNFTTGGLKYQVTPVMDNFLLLQREPASAIGTAAVAGLNVMYANFASAAGALAEAVNVTSTPCSAYTTSTPASATDIINLAAATLSADTSSGMTTVYQLYPVTGGVGSCGCATSGNGLNCWYTTASGVQMNLVGTQTSTATAATGATFGSVHGGLLQQVSSNDVNGLWTTPISSSTFSVGQNYLIPTAFSGGVTTAAVGVEIAVAGSAMTSAVLSYITTEVQATGGLASTPTVIVFDARGNTTLLGSSTSAFITNAGTPSTIFDTSDQAVVSIAQVADSQLSGVLTQEASFSQYGLLYTLQRITGSIYLLTQTKFPSNSATSIWTNNFRYSSTNIGMYIFFNAPAASTVTPATTKDATVTAATKSRNRVASSAWVSQSSLHASPLVLRPQHMAKTGLLQPLPMTDLRVDFTFPPIPIPSDFTIPPIPSDFTIPPVPSDFTLPVPSDFTIPPIPSDITLPGGITVPPGFTIPPVPSDITLPPSFTLPGGITLPAGFTLPAGVTLPPGFTLPGGITLPPGFTLPTDITLPPGFTIPTDITLPPDFTFPGGFTLPPGFTIPSGTLPPGFTLPGGITLPPGFTLPSFTMPPIPTSPVTPTPVDHSSDILKADSLAGASFAVSTYLTGYTAVAVAVGTLYTNLVTSSPTVPTNANVTAFVRGAYIAQKTFSDELNSIFVVYAQQGTTLGQVGCKNDNMGGAACFYTNSAGALVTFKDWNIAGTPMSSPMMINQTNDLYTAVRSQLQVATGFGKWLAPTQWTDSQLGITDNVITFLLPQGSSSMIGSVTATVVINVRYAAIKDLLSVYIPCPNSEIIIVDNRNNIFIATSDTSVNQTLLNTNLWPAASVPVKRIAELYTTAQSLTQSDFEMTNLLYLTRSVQLPRENQIVFADAVPAAGSSSGSGPIFTFPVFRPSQWVLYQRSPLSAPASTVSAAATVMLNAIAINVGTLQKAYANFGAMCTYITASNATALQAFFRASFSLLQGTGMDASAHVTYRLPGTSSGWGECGCSSTSGSTNCFFTTSAGTFVAVSGTNAGVITSTASLSLMPNDPYIAAIKSQNLALGQGTWIDPTVRSAPLMLATAVVSYVVPIQTDASGNFLAVMCIDVALAQFSSLLQGVVQQATTIYDYNAFTYVTSSYGNVPSNQVYEADSTTDSTVNLVTTTVSSYLDDSLDVPIAFAANNVFYDVSKVNSVAPFVIVTAGMTNPSPTPGPTPNPTNAPGTNGPSGAPTGTAGPKTTGPATTGPVNTSKPQTPLPSGGTFAPPPTTTPVPTPPPTTAEPRYDATITATLNADTTPQVFAARIQAYFGLQSGDVTYTTSGNNVTVVLHGVTAANVTTLKQISPTVFGASTWSVQSAPADNGSPASSGLPTGAIVAIVVVAAIVIGVIAAVIVKVTAAPAVGTGLRAGPGGESINGQQLDHELQATYNYNKV